MKYKVLSFVRYDGVVRWKVRYRKKILGLFHIWTFLEEFDEGVQDFNMKIFDSEEEAIAYMEAMKEVVYEEY